jgi:hypothetical protein
MERFLFGISLALWLATASFAQTPVTIDLGPTEDVKTLYSYPNCAEVCSVYRTLPETIKHYLSQSLKRDGFDATTVDVSESAGRISVRLTGAGAVDYVKVLPDYLKAGTLGLKGARELLDALGPDGHRLWGATPGVSSCPTASPWSTIAPSSFSTFRRIPYCWISRIISPRTPPSGGSSCS